MTGPTVEHLVARVRELEQECARLRNQAGQRTLNPNEFELRLRAVVDGKLLAPVYILMHTDQTNEPEDLLAVRCRQIYRAMRSEKAA